MKLRKIALAEFINQLIEIYEMGADFIDIHGVSDETSDTLRIEVKTEYMRKDLTDDIIDDIA